MAFPEELPGEVSGVGLGAASGRVEIHVRKGDFHRRCRLRFKGRRQFTLSFPLVKPSRGCLPSGAGSAKIPAAFCAPDSRDRSGERIAGFRRVAQPSADDARLKLAA